MKKELLKIYAFIYRNIIFTIRNIFTFFDILFWPVVGIISVGMMGKFLKLEKNVISFLLVGSITQGTLQVVQLEVCYGILYEIWSKSIKQIFIAPTKYYHYIIGSWLVGILRGILVFFLLSILSILFFNFYLPKIQTVFIFLSGIFLMGLIIGMIVNFFIILYGQRIDIIAWSISILLMLICGIYYPINILPRSIIFIAKFIPLTYFLEYFRAHFGFPTLLNYGLQTGFFLSIFYLFILHNLINLAYRYSKKTGMILKLSE